MTDQEMVIGKIKGGAKVFVYDASTDKPSNVSKCIDTKCDKFFVDDIGHGTFMAHCRIHNWKSMIATRCENKVLHGEQTETAAGVELYGG